MVFRDGLLTHWQALWPRLEQDWTWGAFWLGHLGSSVLNVYGDLAVHPGVRQFSGVSRAHGAGAFAYVLRKKGAQELLEVVRTQGVQQAIDWFLFERFGDMVCYYASPPLVEAPAGRGRDSDNAEDYPQVRLLLQHRESSPMGAGEEPPPSSRLFITSPAHLSRVVGGQDIAVRVELETEEAVATTLERHRDTRLCLQLAESAPSRVEIPLCRPAMETSGLTIGTEGLKEGPVEVRVTLKNARGQVEATSSCSVLVARNGTSADYAGWREGSPALGGQVFRGQGLSRVVYDEAFSACTRRTGVSHQHQTLRACMLGKVKAVGLGGKLVKNKAA